MKGPSTTLQLQRWLAHKHATCDVTEGGYHQHTCQPAVPKKREPTLPQQIFFCTRACFESLSFDQQPVKELMNCKHNADSLPYEVGDLIDLWGH
jgi:hypothetical protein